MDPTTVVALVAGLAAFLKVLDMADRALHTFGLSKMLSSQLHHLAAMPGNKLAPVEDSIANALDTNKDLAAIRAAERVTDAANGATSIGKVVAAVESEVIPDAFKPAATGGLAG